VQSPDRSQAQWPFAVQYLGHPLARTDEGLQVTTRQTLLFHPEHDGLHRVCGPEVVVLVLIGLDVGYRDAVLIGRRGVLLNLENLLQAAEHPLQIIVVSDLRYSRALWKLPASSPWRPLA
jgi:hypothetical protein